MKKKTRTHQHEELSLKHYLPTDLANGSVYFQDWLEHMDGVGLTERLSAFFLKEVAQLFEYLVDEEVKIKRGYREISLELETLLRKFNKLGNAIKVVPLPVFHDVPYCFLYGATNANSKENTDGNNVSTSGFGIDRLPEPAIQKAVFESLERSIFATYRKKDFIRARLKDLTPNVLDPGSFRYFSEEQLAREYFPRSRFNDSSFFHWIKGADLFSQRKIWLPAQLVFWNYRFPDDEPRLCETNTNGQAVASTLSDAISSALCEVIERDAFMLHWLKKIQPLRVSLEHIAHSYPTLAQVVDDFGYYKLDLSVCFLRNEFNMPVYSAIIRDFSGMGPAVAVGASCAFSHGEAIGKAILESLAVYHTVRKWPELGDGVKTEDVVAFQTPLDRQQRLLLWARQEMISKIEWFVSDQSFRGENLEERFFQINNLEDLKNKIKTLGMRCYCVNATPAPLQKAGFFGVKVIVPEAVPIYLNEQYACLGCARLYKHDSSILHKTTQLNSVPHPFP